MGMKRNNDINTEDLILMLTTINILDDILINNKNKVKYEIAKEVNTASRSINILMRKLFNDNLVTIVDEYKDYIIDYFNEMRDSHKKQLDE